MTTRIVTDWDRLIAAFRDATLVDTYYLNARTGEILYHNPRKIGLQRSEKVEARVFEEPDWLEIPFVESDDEFSAMKDFASSKGAGRARKALEEALTSPKPFRQFRTTLARYPSVTEEWEAVRLRAALERLVEFCQEFEIAIEHPAFDAVSAAMGRDLSNAGLTPASSLSIGKPRGPAAGRSGPLQSRSPREKD